MLGSEFLKSKISFKNSTILLGVIVSAKLDLSQASVLENKFNGILLMKLIINFLRF
jgi:hypothetical protein